MRGEKESRRERRAVTRKEHEDKREASSRLGGRMEKCCFYLAFDWNRIERRGDSENPRQKDFALAAIKLKNATVIQLRELRTHRRRDWCRLRFLIREQNGGLTTANDCGPEQRKTRNYPERGREGERGEVGASWTRSTTNVGRKERVQYTRVNEADRVDTRRYGDAARARRRDLRISARSYNVELL